jgi:hypothetical protein
MKKLLFPLLLSGMFIIASCEKPDIQEEFQQEQSSPSTDNGEFLLKNGHGNQGQGPRVLNFRTHLSGAQEVPPAETNATGQAIFQLRKNGTELHYKVIVANIENVTMAHIHLAPAGVNGPVVAWLYPSGPPPQLIPGPFNGVLAQGVITSTNLVGPLLGESLSDLMDAIIAGNAYVNVHTQQFPGGEIRGQIWGNVPGGF